MMDGNASTLEGTRTRRNGSMMSTQHKMEETYDSNKMDPETVLNQQLLEADNNNYHSGIPRNFYPKVSILNHHPH